MNPAEKFVTDYLTQNPNATSPEVMAAKPRDMTGVYPALIGRIRRALAGTPEPAESKMTLEQRVRALEKAVAGMGAATALVSEVRTIKRHVGLA